MSMHFCLFGQVLDEHGGMNIFVSNAAVSNHIGSVFDVSFKTKSIILPTTLAEQFL